jgi:hypothetical protein
MRFLNEILWLMSWPAIVYVSYLLSVWAIRSWEKKNPEQVK